MRNRKILVGIILGIAILLVAIGYAAITNLELNITGNAEGTPNQANFKVRFTGKPEVSDTRKVVANITNDTTGEINVSGLTQRGDKVTAKYTIENISTDISADLAITTTNSNVEYFLIRAEIDKPSIKPGETTIARITVELRKTPITNAESSEIGVNLKAMPVETGNEGTSEGMNSSSENPTWVSINEIFDETGTDPEKLHIGDFVNYDAGTWTQEEIDAIKTGDKSNLQTANGSTSLPTNGFQFGGFTVGSSRNGNATPSNSTYNYVKDKATGQGVTGWRVFDIEGGNVTLISAGNPEDYCHPSSILNKGYISEYILTGNINSDWSNGATEAEKYQKRDWSVYVKGKATSATPLTKRRLDAWYRKYTNTPNADIWDDTTFQKIYQEPYIKYQSMVENYSHYWLSAAYYSYSVCRVDPYSRNLAINGNYALGVRPIVSLRSDVKFTATKTGTKTLTGGNMNIYGGEQTYNVWGIQ